mmetsp:Transcript_14534/g.35434  ORF Transcript_14534/g.35434 Transcript_14534/m.35434 type:complete len:458 (+) Transcript_14534:185-1558(+)
MLAMATVLVVVVAGAEVVSDPLQIVKNEINAKGEDITDEERQAMMSHVSEEWNELQWERDVKSVNLSLNSRGLITEEVSYEQIIENHNTYYNAQHNGDGSEDYKRAIGFLTPWNIHGYTLSERHKSKFGVFSPAWYELRIRIRKDGKLSMLLRGEDLIHQSWTRNVTGSSSMSSNHVRILPRVLFDVIGEKPEMIWRTIIKKQRVQEAIVAKLVKACTTNSFDGLVVDLSNAWHALPAHNQKHGGKDGQHIRPKLHRFIQSISLAMKNSKLSVMLAVPPRRKKVLQRFSFRHEDAVAIGPFVERIIVMTLTFSGDELGPEAPLPWQRSAIEHLLLPSSSSPTASSLRSPSIFAMAIAFEGHRTRGNHKAEIGAKQFVDLLTQHKPKIKWDARSKEHVAVFKDKLEDDKKKFLNIINYPTLYSLSLRISLANELGVGIAIWDLGQGMNYFFDLLHSSS